MSENDDDDLELAALQRRLDDAFETARPRRGFEDELWLRMQGSRPATGRVREAFSGLLHGIRAVPVVPAAAVAAVLVAVLLVGIVSRFGVPHGGGASGGSGAEAPVSGQFFAGGFGRLPTPQFNGAKGQAANAGQPLAAPLRYIWSGKLDLGTSTAPVFRYNEPSMNAADQFATALGAVLRDRPSGFLGNYAAADYTLKVRGTVQSPPSSPAYFIFSSNAMPPVDAAGAGPADQASIFLAQHSLTPQWIYTVEVDGSGDPIKVRYDRQFTVSGYGASYLVDVSGQRYGLEVDLSGNRPVLASGLLPVSLDSADYRIISADDAVRALLASASVAPAAPGPTPGGVVNLNQAELVYVLVPAGDHSFYEPAVLFSGTYLVNGQALIKRILVPAVDPSQRNP